jgi:hypothetical protein
LNYAALKFQLLSFCIGCGSVAGSLLPGLRKAPEILYFRGWISSGQEAADAASIIAG